MQRTNVELIQLSMGLRHKDLCDATKKMEVAKNEKVVNFLKDIIKANPPAIQTLKSWLMKVNNV